MHQSEHVTRLDLGKGVMLLTAVRSCIWCVTRWILPLLGVKQMKSDPVLGNHWCSLHALSHDITSTFSCTKNFNDSIRVLVVIIPSVYVYM